MMYKSAFTDENEEKIQYKIKQFEGPLDLLLQLIDDAKIDIMDIFVSDIVDQYLDYVAHMDTTDMELACDFIEMAAKLLAIKVRALLPREEDDEFFEEDDDIDGDELIRNLKRKKLLTDFSESPILQTKTAELLSSIFHLTSLWKLFPKCCFVWRRKTSPYNRKKSLKTDLRLLRKCSIYAMFWRYEIKLISWNYLRKIIRKAK